MQQEIFVRASISVAQPSEKPDAKYGEGFNYIVEVGFEQDHHATAWVRERLKDVLKQIDHKNLLLDVDLGFKVNSTGLCAWLFRELKANGVLGLVRVELQRGDGFCVGYFD